MKQFILLLLLVLFLWIFAILALPYFWDNLNYPEIFEGINSLFAGLAFAGIIYTILLQRNELNLQRQEIIETRRELKRTADTQERSEYIMTKTAEVNAFSQLLVYYQTAHNTSEPRTPARHKYVQKMNEVKIKVDTILEELNKASDPTLKGNKKDM